MDKQYPDGIARDVKEAIRCQLALTPDDPVELHMNLETDLGADSLDKMAMLSVIHSKYHLVTGDREPWNNIPTVQDFIDMVNTCKTKEVDR